MTKTNHIVSVEIIHKNYCLNGELRTLLFNNHYTLKPYEVLNITDDNLLEDETQILEYKIKYSSCSFSYNFSLNWQTCAT